MKDLNDLLHNHGYFAVWNGQGNEIRRYSIDGLDYIVVSFPKSPEDEYTYLVGDE